MTARTERDGRALAQVHLGRVEQRHRRGQQRLVLVLHLRAEACEQILGNVQAHELHAHGRLADRRGCCGALARRGQQRLADLGRRGRAKLLHGGERKRDAHAYRYAEAGK